MSTQNVQEPAVNTQREIEAVIDAVVAGHAAGDAVAITGEYTADAVRYTLAPPLQQETGTDYGDAAGVQAWLDTFDGPVRLEHRDLKVHAGGDLALAHMLTRMSATPLGAPEPFSFWYRTTFGLTRLDGRWQIMHHHDSTPFHMDGSFRAATDLEPRNRPSVSS